MGQTRQSSRADTLSFLWDDDLPASRPARRRRPSRPARRRGRRHRGLRRALYLLVLLALTLVVAFVIGDNFARGYAQKLAADEIQSSSKLAAKPAVSIKGWPFLTQVASRNVRRIDISARGIRESGLDISSINATASEIRIKSSYTGATIGATAGTAVISYSSLAAKSGVKGMSLAADPSGGPGEAKISLSSLSDLVPASVARFLPSGPVSGVAKITRNGPSAISVQVKSLGRVPLSQLGSAGDFRVTIPQLPLGLTVTGLSMERQGIRVQVAARDTSLSRSGISSPSQGPGHGSSGTGSGFKVSSGSGSGLGSGLKARLKSGLSSSGGESGIKSAIKSRLGR